MALNWDFKKDKMGTVTNNRGHITHLYTGNAFIIGLNEWEENGKNWWSMNWFFVNKDHAKQCLGIGTGEYPMSCVEDWVHFQLDLDFKETKQLVDMLMKIKWAGTIEFYKGGEKE